MKIPKLNWQHIRRAVRNDAKILARDTGGKSATPPKAVLIGASVAAIGAIFLISMAKSPSDAPSQPAITTLADLEISPENLYDFRALGSPENTVVSTRHITLKSGQSLGPLLQKNNVDANTAYAATQAFSTVFKPKDLRAGQNINLYFSGTDNTFSGLTLKPNAQSTVFVTRAQDGHFKARKIAAEFNKQLVRIESQINNSLYLDAQSLGAPDKVIVQFAQIYAHSVDFQRDIRAGDAFEMMFELYQDHQGNTVKAGDLVYTSFSPRGKTSNYYLYTKANGREGYYDVKGKGAKRMLMRTPINGSRLSSRFGRRKHPILGYVKNHTGVDFAAPRGTPIMAAGHGTIRRVGRYGGYGNYVSISHSDGYVTAYAHMSKFARGMRRGKRVVQGQTIGYVGTTGQSTGPHLHYEVHKRGKKINPMRLSTLSGKPLKKQDMPEFKKRVSKLNKLRLSTPPLGSQPELNAEFVSTPDNYVQRPMSE